MTKTVWTLGSMYDYTGRYEHTAQVSDHHIGYTSDRNSLPANWEDLKRKVKARDNEQCIHCGVHYDKYLHVDHIIPRSQGGSHDLANLELLCPVCHSNKHPDNARLRRMAELQMEQLGYDINKFRWLAAQVFARKFTAKVSIAELKAQGYERISKPTYRGLSFGNRK